MTMSPACSLRLRRARIAEEHRRVRHRGRADDEKVDVAAAAQDGGARRRAQVGLGRARLRSRDHCLHRVLAQHAGAAHAVELGRALDDDEVVDEAAREHDLGVRQPGAQIVVLVHRHVVAVARIDLDEADARTLRCRAPDALDHHFGISSAAALAHVGERGLDLASHRFGMRAAHRVDQRRLGLERHHDIGRRARAIPSGR